MHKNVTIDQMRRSLDRRSEAKRVANDARWKQATQDLERIIAETVRRFKPARIYCWGSLLHPETFNAQSDIDIGVEGISEPQAYFDLIGVAAGLTEWPVDIVQMEKIDPVFARLIRRKGKIVYERP